MIEIKITLTCARINRKEALKESVKFISDLPFGIKGKIEEL